MSRNEERPSGEGREIARIALIIYLGIVAVFEVSRFNLASSEAVLSVSSAAASANALDMINAHHICPAQLFAQPVAGAVIFVTRLFVADGTFLPALSPKIPESFEFSGSFSTRAPPQA